MAHKTCGCDDKREPRKREGASVGVQRKPSWPAPGSAAIGVQSKANPGHKIGVAKKPRYSDAQCHKLCDPIGPSIEFHKCWNACTSWHPFT